MVDNHLSQGVHPNHIAFLAFTKKAANEAKERAASRFKLDPEKDLFFFRTLHSLALNLSEIRPEQVLSREHFLELGQKIGISFGRISGMDEDIIDKQNNDHPILNTINLARLRKVSLRQQYNESYIEDDWNTVNYVHKCYIEYKKQRNLYDFTDMLEMFVKDYDRICPTFEITFLDEAQDLSPLQWDIAHALDKKSKAMYAAGDDDQAIYRWAGADVDQFINLEGTSETLDQSFRVPRQIHKIAESIVDRIKHRYPKRYQPNRSISAKISSAVNGWEQLRKGKQITLDTARDVYSFMSSGTRVKRGFKKLSGIDDQDLLDMATLQNSHGLVVGDELIWHKALDRLPEESRVYITALLRRGEKFNGEPRITVSTIHGSKGGESENVVIFTDLSPAADDAMRIGNDDVHRVFYVAVTRAKQNLYIIEPDDNNRSYHI
jgi:superfamily I DNA/RNA helicase